jgi:lipoprotein
VAETTAPSTTVASTKEETPQWVASYTNMSNQSSIDEVKALLSAYIDKESVESFLKLVKEYNEIVGETGLQGDFAPFTKTEYDVEKISNLWNTKMGDFVGTNCRINTYALLKNSIEIPPIEKDDTLLFIDNDAIDKGKLFSSEDKEALNRLFSRVKTEATTDVKVHAAKMEQFLSQFKFNENARMLSVVIHDNLDGESLFIGHVGVLVPTSDGFLFVEKLTFEEPYQAIKFSSKEDVYKYLSTKYQDYTGEGLAKPFIMDNNKWVEMK